MSPTGELTHAQLFPLVLTIWRALLDDAVNPDGIMHLSDFSSLEHWRSMLRAWASP